MLASLLSATRPFFVAYWLVKIKEQGGYKMSKKPYYSWFHPSVLQEMFPSINWLDQDWKETFSKIINLGTDDQNPFKNFSQEELSKICAAYLCIASKLDESSSFAKAMASALAEGKDIEQVKNEWLKAKKQKKTIAQIYLVK